MHLVPYNLLWPGIFQKEKDRIANACAPSPNVVQSVMHVGSTAVPELWAKPIIDILLEVQDLQAAGTILKTAGYFFKGEYNIPLRHLYKKPGAIPVHLHVYPAGHAEVQLHEMFRDALRRCAKLRDAYQALKKRCAEAETAGQKTQAGVTLYNKGKHQFIQNVLHSAGFQGMCMHVCGHDNEIQAFNLIQKKWSNSFSVGEKNDASAKSLVLIQGTKIVAAARLSLLEGDQAQVNFLDVLHQDGSEMHVIGFFAECLEAWCKSLGLSFLTVAVLEKNAKVFQKKGFTPSVQEKQIGGVGPEDKSEAFISPVMLLQKFLA